MRKQVLKEEQFLKQYIKKIVNECLKSLNENYYFEEESSGNNNGETSNNNFRRKRVQIQKFFSQDGVNPAAYAYKLFNVEPVEGKDTNDMKNGRSLFMKKLHNEKNQDGSTYEFTSEELNRLYSLISGNELS